VLIVVTMMMEVIALVIVLVVKTKFAESFSASQDVFLPLPLNPAIVSTAMLKLKSAKWSIRYLAVSALIT